MFKVETYQNPEEYFATLLFNNDEIHLTAVTALSVVLKDKASAQNVKPVICTYENMQNLLFPNWNHPLTQVLLASRARHYLQTLSGQHPPIIRSLEQQIEDLVKSFCFAVELGVRHLPAKEKQSPAEKAFHDLFNILIEDKQIQALIKELDALNIEQLKEVTGLASVRTLYIYNFYRIKAPEMLFFHRCKRLGIPVIFRIPYYHQYPVLSRGWKELYEKAALTPSKDWEQAKEVEINRGLRFIEYLEGMDTGIKHDQLEIDILSYSSPAQFKQYLTQEDKRPQRGKVQYCAFSSGLLNKSMREATKLQDEVVANQDNILNSPIGKFFFYLYECKKHGKDIYLNYDNYVECITSGWIETKGISGTIALPLLKDLEPYMEGISTMAEIKDRLNTLEELLQTSNIFDTQAKEQTQRNSTKKYLCNPFRVLPYVLSERYNVTVRQLYNLTVQLENTLLHLLPEDGAFMAVETHLKLLKETWDKLQNLYQLPSFVEEAINKTLKFSVPSDWEAAPYELRRYMNILLNINNNRETEEVTQKQEIHALEQLDGLILDAEEIHITDLSTQSMLNYINNRSTMPLYLNHTKLREALKCQYSEQTYKVLCHCLYVDYIYNQYKESFLKFIIFYTLSFFSGKSLKISWIKNLNEYDDECIFIKIMASLYTENGQPGSWTEPEDELDLSEKTPFAEKKGSIIPPIQGKIPGVSWLDLDFCPRKFFYSNILNPHPVYESDFHQQLAFATIGSLLAQQANGKEKVQYYLYPLFPQWPYELKDNLIRTSYYRKLKNHYQFQNINYPKAMDNLQRLRSKYYVTKKFKIKNAYNRGEVNDQKWAREFGAQVTPDEVKATPGRHCNMCPHLLICTKGEFAIDRNDSSSQG